MHEIAYQARRQAVYSVVLAERNKLGREWLTFMPDAHKVIRIHALHVRGHFINPAAEYAQGECHADVATLAVGVIAQGFQLASAALC